ncbi:putative WRKY transcription factor 11 [Apostasia shenzhenica]|uniref:Putative WRKY transcription factor 11 n=1 Tax=Apostasia shenzhenica TaxID=1088818 RepID=A0A2I0APT9_9ASPA|nr:putative WRKY transcription factor 11 [Apostasia shenzhenica]
MSVDLIGHAKMDDKISIQEAAVSGIRSTESLMFHLNRQQHQNSSSPASPADAPATDYRAITDHTVSSFKKMISILTLTGHARFRRGPVAAEQTASPPPPLVATISKPSSAVGKTAEIAVAVATTTDSGNSSLSSVTGDGRVSNGRESGSSPVILPLVASVSAGGTAIVGKPPLSSSVYKKRGYGQTHSKNVSGKLAGAGAHCHCPESRKNRAKMTIRVPAVSTKLADIPSDEYCWRKYGQKPIKGSPYPR